MEWLIVIPFFVMSVVIVIGVIAAFFVPFMYWEEIKTRRKMGGKSISKWDYVQEIFLVIISPTILTCLGVIYLVELFDLKF